MEFRPLMKTYYHTGTVLQVEYNDESIIKFVLVLGHTKNGTPQVAPVEMIDGVPTLDDRYESYIKTMHWSSSGWRVYGRNVSTYI